MSMFSKIKFSKSKVTSFIEAIPPAQVAAVLTGALVSSPTFAEGFTKANDFLESLNTGLHVLTGATITLAVLWVGYKVLFDGNSIRDCKNVIIGAILIASASELGAWWAS